MSSIEPVRAAPAYELAADQIRKAIQLGRFLPGDHLPPERVLAQELHVSRTTIREAVRILKGQGLLEIKRGAAGGLVVLPVETSKADLKKFIKKQTTIVENLFEYRLANECAAAGAAALRRTREHLKKMDNKLREMDSYSNSREARGNPENVPLFFAADSEFHILIAKASGNPLFIKAVEETRPAMFLPVGSVFGRLDERANDFHEDIFQAIKEQDAKGAYQAMSEHIMSTKAQLDDILKISRKEY